LRAWAVELEEAAFGLRAPLDEAVTSMKSDGVLLSGGLDAGIIVISPGDAAAESL